MTAEEIAAGLGKMIENREQWLANCERMIELLQPEWDRFEARTGHNPYVSRDYADHTSEARKWRKELELLNAALTIQRAFEERERKLRKALETLEASLTRDMGAGYAGVALCQALKEPTYD